MKGDNMNKSKKFIGLLVVIVVGIIIYMYPKSFVQTYEGVQVYEDGNKVGKVNVEIDGEVKKAFWVWQRLKFSEELNGSIIIDGEEYNLHPVDLYMFPDENGNYTDNDIYQCSLYNEKHNILDEEDIQIYVTHDKSKLYIVSGNKEFIHPYETDEDYQKVKDRMDRNPII